MHYGYSYNRKVYRYNSYKDRKYTDICRKSEKEVK